jgi:hypothetical protein
MKKQNPYELLFETICISCVLWALLFKNDLEKVLLSS